LPGGQLVWGILLAVVLNPHRAGVCMLPDGAAALGGAMLQSRVLVAACLTLVMSGFVIWISSGWRSGWLLAWGFALPGLGATLGSAGMIEP
jgi:hypothetical protein